MFAWPVHRLIDGGFMRFFIFLFFFIPAISFADSFSLELQKVGLSELSAAVFKGVLKKDFVISPDVLADDRKLSISLTNKEPAKVLDALKNSLAASGLTVSEKSGVYYVEKPQQQTQQPDNALRLAGSPSSSFRPDTQPVLNPDGTPSDAGQKIDRDLYTYRLKYRQPSQFEQIARTAGAVVPAQLSSDFFVFSATKEVYAKLLPVLEVLDTVPQSITIRAAVVEFSDTSSNVRSFNAALSLLAGKLKISFKPSSLVQNSITWADTSFSAVLSAMDGDTRFNYLAQPVVRVLNGEKARLTVGSDVPVRGQSVIDKNGNVQQSVEYQASGLILDLLPRIVGDIITLTVDQQISSFSPNNTSSIDSPVKLKRQASTVLDIKRGQLLVMAGLDEDKKTDSSSGFAWLPAFLQSKSRDTTKSQILLMIEVLSI